MISLRLAAAALILTTMVVGEGWAILPIRGPQTTRAVRAYCFDNVSIATIFSRVAVDGRFNVLLDSAAVTQPVSFHSFRSTPIEALFAVAAANRLHVRVVKPGSARWDSLKLSDGKAQAVTYEVRAESQKVVWSTASDRRMIQLSVSRAEDVARKLDEDKCSGLTGRVEFHAGYNRILLRGDEAAIERAMAVVRRLDPGI